jgi:hypothetical protein
MVKKRFRQRRVEETPIGNQDSLSCRVDDGEILCRV